MVFVPPRQMELLRLVASGISKQRDLMVAMSIKSTNGVADHVRALKNKGMVQSILGKIGTLTLTDRGWAKVGPCEHMTDEMQGHVRTLALYTPPSTVDRWPKFCPWCGRRIPPKVSS